MMTPRALTRTIEMGLVAWLLVKGLKDPEREDLVPAVAQRGRGR
jgi:hypothetical protein